MNTFSRLTLAAGAALFVGISTTGFNAQGHPHGEKTQKRTQTTIVTTQSPDTAPTPMTGEIAVKSETAETAETEIIIIDDLDNQDFNINDFLGNDGQVDVKKLRAYENKKQQYIADNKDDHAAHNAKDMDTQDLPATLNIEDTIQATLEGPAPVVIGVSETLPEHAGNDRKHHSDKKRRRGHKKRKGRTISLSGDTTIHIAPGGAVTVTNNGETIVPLSMARKKSGKASAMVMDDCEPAKITVEKTITTENGKRKVHLEVDMETNIVD